MHFLLAEPRILLWREPQEHPTSAGLDSVFKHLPALRISPGFPTLCKFLDLLRVRKVFLRAIRFIVIDCEEKRLWQLFTWKPVPRAGRQEPRSTITSLRTTRTMYFTLRVPGTDNQLGEVEWACASRCSGSPSHRPCATYALVRANRPVLCAPRVRYHRPGERGRTVHAQKLMGHESTSTTLRRSSLAHGLPQVVPVGQTPGGGW
jgi:hypothetical protein